MYAVRLNSRSPRSYTESLAGSSARCSQSYSAFSKDSMRTLLAMLALVSTTAFADCSPDWRFSPPCSVTPDTPRSVPEPETLYLLGAAGLASVVVRVIRRK